MTWLTKDKIALSTPSRKILTPDGKRILVGSTPSLILIWKAAIEQWTKNTKQTSTWTKNTKQTSTWSLKTI